MAYLKSELSEKNKYWIPKHRYYELKHYTLQYPHWQELYAKYEFKMEAHKDREVHGNEPSNPTEKWALIRAECKRAMEQLEQTVDEACKDEPALAPYLFKAVTEGLPFVKLQSGMDIPCGKDMYYEYYRKFFYLLSQKRGI